MPLPVLISSLFLQLTCQFGMKRYCFSTQALADSPVGGMVDIPLAQTGEGIAECELLKWFVQEVSVICFQTLVNESLSCGVLGSVTGNFVNFPFITNLHSTIMISITWY